MLMIRWSETFPFDLGGSACNDGGISLLSGTGYGFFDEF